MKIRGKKRRKAGRKASISPGVQQAHLTTPPTKNSITLIRLATTDAPPAWRTARPRSVSGSFQSLSNPHRVLNCPIAARSASRRFASGIEKPRGFAPASDARASPASLPEKRIRLGKTGPPVPLDPKRQQQGSASVTNRAGSGAPRSDDERHQFRRGVTIGRRKAARRVARDSTWSDLATTAPNGAKSHAPETWLKRSRRTRPQRPVTNGQGAAGTIK